MPQFGMVCSAIARSCHDTNPEMKQKVSNFASQLAQAHSEKVGQFFKTTVEGLTVNLGHQHSKVRKVTLRGLQEVVCARNAEPFLNDSIPVLRQIMNDRSQDVRINFYNVIKHWMTKMEIMSLRSYESHFILFLLNGIADENQDIAQGCVSFLEEHGKRMKEALQALGEEDAN